ncbi:unnamed protein product [Nesidiocoris tenuis]|uniref:Condensin-2 complex subunit H2 C-terminal domain-containing protein n=1 Tax=Nesidiocoris tenuis TaxID=355587 RepID=A0A6H5FV42_9HEMI|nr:unnamed protein product [Nesidiocoris tenuis]
MDEERLYEELLKPYPALREWSESLKGYLDSYLRRVHGENLTNFVQAALILNNSSKIYAKKVDILHQAVREFFDDLLKSNAPTAGHDRATTSAAPRNGAYRAFENDLLEPLDFVVSRATIRLPRKDLKKPIGPIERVYLSAPSIKRTDLHLSTPLFTVDGFDIGRKEDFGLFQRDNLSIFTDEGDGNPLASDQPEHDVFPGFSNEDYDIPSPCDGAPAAIADDTLTPEVEAVEREIVAVPRTSSVPGPRDPWAQIVQSAVPADWTEMQVQNGEELFTDLSKPVNLRCRNLLPEKFLNHPIIERFKANVASRFNLTMGKGKCSDVMYSWTRCWTPMRFVSADEKEKRSKMMKKIRISKRSNLLRTGSPIVDFSSILTDTEPCDLLIDESLPLLNHDQQAVTHENNNNQPTFCWATITSEAFLQKRREYNLTAWQLGQRVQKWHDTIAPRLREDEERRPFDPLVYGHQIVQTLGAEGGTRTFEDVMDQLHDNQEFQAAEWNGTRPGTPIKFIGFNADATSTNHSNAFSHPLQLDSVRPTVIHHVKVSVVVLRAIVR